MLKKNGEKTITNSMSVINGCLDFDAFLKYIGEFGLYQKLLLLALLPFVFFWAFTYLSQIFLILVPRDHWCHIPEIEFLTKDEQLELAIPKTEDGKYDKCSMYDVDYNAIIAFNITQGNESWPKISCQNGWNYDREKVPYETISMEYNWVCENSNLAPYSVAIFFGGSILGCFCFGFIADHCGRIPALMLANLCGLIGGVLSAFCKNFLSFSLSRFIVGMAIDSCFVPMYILLMENVGVQYRSIIGNVSIAFYYTPSACILPWIAYYSPNWRFICLVTSLPIISGLLLYFILPESPRWLLSVGMIDEGMKNVKRASKINGKTIPKDVLLGFHQCCELFYNAEQLLKRHTVLDVFRYPRMRRITIILLVIGMLVTLVYDAHVRIIVDIGADIFITFSLANLTELPAGLLTFLLIDRMGRKPTLFLVLMLCGLGSLLAAVLPWKIMVTAAAIFSRLCVSMSYNICLQWQAEVLPTVVRGQGVAFINILSATATLMSPFICSLDAYIENSPLIILAVLSVIGGFLVIFLPETKNAVMPQTLEEAEELWNQNFWFYR